MAAKVEEPEEEDTTELRFGKGMNLVFTDCYKESMIAVFRI